MVRKSTLINIISGSISPDEGKVLLNNANITNMKEHQRAPYFGRVFQDPMVGTAAYRTVLENLALAYGRDVHARYSVGHTKKRYSNLIDDLKTLDLGLESVYIKSWFAFRWSKTGPTLLIQLGINLRTRIKRLCKISHDKKAGKTSLIKLLSKQRITL